MAKNKKAEDALRALALRGEWMSPTVAACCLKKGDGVEIYSPAYRAFDHWGEGENRDRCHSVSSDVFAGIKYTQSYERTEIIFGHTYVPHMQPRGLYLIRLMKPVEEQAKKKKVVKKTEPEEDQKLDKDGCGKGIRKLSAEEMDW